MEFLRIASVVVGGAPLCDIYRNDRQINIWLQTIAVKERKSIREKRHSIESMLKANCYGLCGQNLDLCNNETVIKLSCVAYSTHPIAYIIRSSCRRHHMLSFLMDSTAKSCNECKVFGRKHAIWIRSRVRRIITAMLEGSEGYQNKKKRRKISDKHTQQLNYDYRWP